MTLLLALLVAQASENPAADGAKDLEKLRAQVRELQDRVTQLEDASVRDAELIQRLRTAIKTLDLAQPTGPVAQPAGAPPPKGPVNVLKARVLHVDTKFNFLLINIGREKNLQPGYRFEIVRKVFSPGNPDPRLDKLGSAEFEKYSGEEESTSKLRVVEGTAADMKLDDEAVAIRSIEERKEPAKPVETAKEPKNGVYKITGTAGRPGAPGFTINYGSLDGAKQTDIVFVYKDGVYKNKLRLDSIAKEFSVGNLIQAPAGGADTPETGDQVFTREFKKSVAGKVAMIDTNRGEVATDLRQRDGVHIGQRLEIRRLGQKVGILTVTSVQAWGSWAKPDQETKLDTIQKGDFVEAPEN